MEHLKTFETFQDAPVEIKNKLEELIEKLLAKYKGGRPFFDALDDQIKNSLNEDITISLMKGVKINIFVHLEDLVIKFINYGKK